MRAKIFAILCLAIALGAATAWAKAPVKYTVTIKGVYSNSSAPGACPDGFAAYCPGTNPSIDCTCYTATGTVPGSGSAGKGTMTFYETYDNEGSTMDDGECAPAYGDIEIVGKKDTESIAFIGTDCSLPDSLGDFLSGGCNLSAPSTLFSSAGGICTGHWVITDGVESFTLTITGKAIRK
jgi:hypothetical protein